MLKAFIGVDDVMAIVGCKKAKAYALIKQCNDELTQKNFLTNKGRVSSEYFCKRMKLDPAKVTMEGELERA